MCLLWLSRAKKKNRKCALVRISVRNVKIAGLSRKTSKAEREEKSAYGYNFNNRWMDDLRFDVFQSYQDDVWMIMKGCVQWNSVYG